MASSSEPRIGAFLVGAAIAKGKFVKAGSSRKYVAVCSAATDKIVGITQNATTAAEDTAEVALPGGGAKVLLGGTVSFGDLLTSDGSGQAIATTTAANRYGAVAMEDGVSGDIIGCEVVLGLI